MTYQINNTIIVDDNSNIYANVITSNTISSPNIIVGLANSSSNLNLIGSVYSNNESNYQISSSTLSLSLPSLDLDFVNNPTIDSRITFTRSSTATRTNQRGYLEYVSPNQPRIEYNPISGNCSGLLLEEQRTNLVGATEDFQYWTISNCSLESSTIVAPDGSLNARLMYPTSTNIPFLDYGISIANNTYYTFSCYFNAGNNPNANIGILLYTNSFQPVNSSSASAAFNLNNGTIISNNCPYSGITYVGNGWYRCWVSQISITSGVVDWQLGRFWQNPTRPSSINQSIAIWGAQVEAGTTPTSYIPSTQTLSYRNTSGTYVSSNGLIQLAAANTARYSYNPNNLLAPPKNLIELSSTNLLTYYTVNSSNWGSTTLSVTNNAATAPDGSSNASLIVPYANTNTANFIFYQTFGGANTTAYTFSIFTKASGYNYVIPCLTNLGFGTSIIFNGPLINLANGSIYGTSGNTQSYSITPYANGWYRISSTVTSANSNGPWVAGVLVSNNQIFSSFNGDGVSGIYVWGAQVEQANSASSLIPSYGSPLTRATDVIVSSQATRTADNFGMYDNDFSSWYNQSQGTIYGEFTYTGRFYDSPATLNFLQLADNSGDSIYMRMVSGNGSSPYADFIYTSSGNGNIDSGGWNITPYATYKRAIAISANNIVHYMNSLADFNYASNPYNLTGNIDRLMVFGNSMYLRKIAYYPRMLSNTELFGITT